MAFTTRQSVLQRVRAGQEVGWEEFHRMYRPLIHLRGRDRGLSSSELDVLVQDVMMTFFRGEKVAKYDSQKARFRSFLKTIIDRRAIDILRRRRNHESIDDLAEKGVHLESPDFGDMEEGWDKAWYDHLLKQATQIVRTEVDDLTYDAFEMTVFKGIAPKEVAEKLGMTAQNVYVIRHRMLRRLKETVESMQEA